MVPETADHASICFAFTRFAQILIQKDKQRGTGRNRSAQEVTNVCTLHPCQSNHRKKTEGGVGQNEMGSDHNRERSFPESQRSHLSNRKIQILEIVIRSEEIEKYPFQVSLASESCGYHQSF